LYIKRLFYFIIQGIPNVNINILPFFTILLPSIIQTTNYDYNINLYMIYDVGDEFYDNTVNFNFILSQIKTIFIKNFNLWLETDPLI
jgi:hypothetical protein